MDPSTLTLRPSVLADLSAVDTLLARSYRRLLARDYPPSVMVLAVPRIDRARPELLDSGRYYLLWQGTRLVGAGGFSLTPPRPTLARLRKGPAPIAHVRHLATDPNTTRQGVGRRILSHVLEEAGRAGARTILAQATRTAVPFYRDMGFETIDDQSIIMLAPGIEFPAVAMRRRL